MALRNIVTKEQDVLYKKCRTVEKFDERLWTLLDDMKETLYKAQGYGLAAPQVGILKRVAVIDVGEGYIELINPEILELSGEQTGQEGCLSVPGKAGIVTRANYAKVKAYNEHMKEIIVEGEGLLARALQHEIDHLSGVLYVSKVEGELMTAEMEMEE